MSWLYGGGLELDEKPALEGCLILLCFSLNQFCLFRIIRLLCSLSPISLFYSFCSAYTAKGVVEEATSLVLSSLHTKKNSELSAPFLVALFRFFVLSSPFFLWVDICLIVCCSLLGSLYLFFVVSPSPPKFRLSLLCGVYAVSLHLGTGVFVGFTNTRGGVAPVFAHPKGLERPTMSLSPNSLRRAFQLIAARNPDPLAPLKAAASLVHPPHLARLDEPSLKVLLTQNLKFLLPF